MKIAILILLVFLIIVFYKACLYRVGILVLCEWIKENHTPLPNDDEIKSLTNKVLKTIWKS